MAAPLTERVVLRHAAVPAFAARLRELRGEDELAVTAVDTRTAVALLDRVLDVPDAEQLSASDRDGALAALHRALWGDRIVSSLRCGACGAEYDLSFALTELQRTLWQAAEPARVEGPRVLRDAQGEAWRLPR